MVYLHLYGQQHRELTKRVGRIYPAGGRDGLNHVCKLTDMNRQRSAEGCGAGKGRYPPEKKFVVGDEPAKPKRPTPGGTQREESR